MNRRVKIRLESWYWGNYEWSDSAVAKKNGWKVGATANGYKFELYDEELHGWQHSEEAKKGQKQYERGF